MATATCGGGLRLQSTGIHGPGAARVSGLAVLTSASMGAGMVVAHGSGMWSFGALLGAKGDVWASCR